MKEIKTDVIIRTCILVLSLVNLILENTGHSILPITNEDISNTVSIIAVTVSSLWAWWKNNSFTRNAIRADEYLVRLRNESK